MPGKGKHGKSKHPQHISKKARAIQRQQAVTERPASTGQAAPQEVRPAAAAAPAASAPKPAAAVKKVAAMQYQFIGAEIRRIGILASIIIVILIVLSQVLS
jgi:hypothetical protein